MKASRARKIDVSRFQRSGDPPEDLVTECSIWFEDPETGKGVSLDFDYETRTFSGCFAIKRGKPGTRLRRLDGASVASLRAKLSPEDIAAITRLSLAADKDPDRL